MEPRRQSLFDHPAVGIRGEVDLGHLGGRAEACQGTGIVAEVAAVLLANQAQEVLDDPLIEIVAPEMIVAAARADLVEPVADLDHRDVECPTAEVVDQDAYDLTAGGDHR